MTRDNNKIIRKVLVTGNLGYIGSILVPMLLKRGYEVIGYDINYYDDECLLENPKANHIRQIIKDIREISDEEVRDVDAIIHLAALSNDPLGEFNPKLTEAINRDATIKLAMLAKKNGVKRFVYSSSQSMYGVAKEGIVNEDSPVNPLTAYARTKYEAECSIKEFADDKFTVVCYRPSTIFGASPKLRCDIVYNNLVACAYTTKKIEIKSDGTPWRPVVHVKDVCNAFISGLIAPEKLVNRQSYNVGIKDGNYQVKDLADAARKVVPGCEVIFTGEHGSDSRTYKVSFDKILTELKDYYKPEWNLISGGKELVELFKRSGFTEEDFRGRKCMRISQLKWLVEHGKIDKNFKRIN